jgi:CheY-like chemotaxis protein
VALREGRRIAAAIAFDEVLPQPVEPPALAEALRRHTPPEARGQGVPVLLVDDDPTRRETLELALAAAGLAGLSAADRRGAVELARAHRPRAVVLSLSMPPLEAFALGRALQRDARTARLPLLALAPRDLAAGERGGIAGQLAARLDGTPDELTTAIETVLGRGREETVPGAVPP